MEMKIIIAGSGGQGILFLGKLICQAAMIEGKNVTWFPSYGAEMRGGTANCTIIISDDMIGSPVVKNPDFMIVLNNASLRRFLPRIQEKGWLFFDSTLVTDNVDGKNGISIFPIPSSTIAGSIGNPRLSNMVLLGAFSQKSNIVKKDSILKALEMTISSDKKSLLEKNISAINRGIEFAQN